MSAFLGDFWYIPSVSYIEAYAYSFVGTILLYSFAGWLRSYFLDIILFLTKRTIKPHKYVPILPVGSLNEVTLDSNFEEIRKHHQLQTTKPWDWKQLVLTFLRILSIIASWYALLCMIFFPSILSGFGIIPLWSSALITLCIFIFKFVCMCVTYCPKFVNDLKDNHTHRRWYSRIWKKVLITTRLYKFGFGFFAFIAIAYTIAVPLMSSDVCLSDFNDTYGQVVQGYKISTRFSRHFELNTVCPDGEICQLYATLAEDASTSVILNIHTGVDIESLTVGYDTVPNSNSRVRGQKLQFIVAAKKFYMDLEPRGDRNVHSAFLAGMTPNTMYVFEIYSGDKVLKSGHYRTLPTDQLERNVWIASGGDVGTSLEARNMTKALHNYDLDVIMIGGDMAYENGMRSCYYNIDLFFKLFDPINEKHNRLVPLLISIGNHDIGFTVFTTVKFDKTKNLYYNYFPQHSRVDSRGNLLPEVPELDERLPYNYHVIGNTVHTFLDSGYTFGYKGVQAKFIADVSNRYPNLVKMANFHVPIYPVCLNSRQDPRVIREAREFWAPLFETHKFASVFENHVHLYKKTHPLRNGRRSLDGKGVTYFGDGNWGISPYICAYDGNNTGIMEAYGRARHVWLVELSTTTLKHFAVNDRNQIFDRAYDLNVADYV